MAAGRKNPEHDAQRRELSRLSEQAERRAVVAALVAEVGHELQGPLNVFRHGLTRLEQGQTLDPEDLAILREELARSARLSARLRASARGSLERSACSPEGLALRAIAESSWLEAGELDLSLPAAPSLRADPTLLTLALKELLHNAWLAKRERAGVRLERGPIGELAICVWDDGSGFPMEYREALRWGVSSRPAAAGLGLTLAFRIARAHGFSLEMERGRGLTELRLTVPARDVVEVVAKVGA